MINKQMSQMEAETEARLREVFRAVFEMPPSSDVQNLRQLTEPRWDSLAHVSLVAAIESEFGLEIDTADVLGITSYKAAAQLLKERLR
jgi:acyl carrier protein